MTDNQKGGVAMTSNEHTTSNRHHLTSRKERTMFAIEHRLADVGERQQRFRADREADRAAQRLARSSLRRTVGRSLVRLGRRIGGESMTAPAWQG
jgi:hypothetical protein